MEHYLVQYWDATGNLAAFWLWQRVNEAVTGDCVPLFSKEA